MLRPSEYRDYRGRTAYYNSVQIGLVPEGKVAVWLQGSGSESNYRVTPSVLKTVSGDKLDICKGITRFSNGYEYGKDTEDFIKGKKYPFEPGRIDVFTRCVSGMVVTLEAPSTVSVGLCLAHVVCDKCPWLERLRADEW
jgi:hypothetical protein